MNKDRSPRAIRIGSRSSLSSKEYEKAYMVDIDGVICEHVANEFPEKMRTAKEIPGAREWVKARYDEGSYVCFFTARLESHRKITEDWLRDHEFEFHEIIFGKPRGGNYHYIDKIHVQATTFKGKFTPLVSQTMGIEVFQEEETKLKRTTVCQFSFLCVCAGIEKSSTLRS
jgi:hypothetical protein